MSDSATKPRPQFRNISVTDLANYRLPLPGKVSILHRVSGALLFLCMPLVILPVFFMSISSPASYAILVSYVGHPLVKLIFLVLIWGYLHHFCAGIRFLLLDLHKGLEKQCAQRSALSVLVISLALTVVFGLKLFGVF